MSASPETTPAPDAGDLDVIWRGPQTEAGRGLLDIIERGSAPVQGAWGPAIAMAEQEARRVALSSPETTPAGVLAEAALAAVLWGEFGWASPDPDSTHPRLLNVDDPYWREAAGRLIAQLADSRIELVLSRLPQLAVALRGESA